MNRKVAKFLRKLAYPDGFDRVTYYITTSGGGIKCLHERGKFLMLKKEYKHARSGY